MMASSIQLARDASAASMRVKSIGAITREVYRISLLLEAGTGVASPRIMRCA